jgi:hypothetical protein
MFAKVQHVGHGLHRVRPDLRVQVDVSTDAGCLPLHCESESTTDPALFCSQQPDAKQSTSTTPPNKTHTTHAQESHAQKTAAYLRKRGRVEAGHGLVCQRLPAQAR